jgi:hypothetical protein
MAMTAQFARSCSVGALRKAWTIMYMATTAPKIANIHNARLSAAIILATLSPHQIRRQFGKSKLLRLTADYNRRTLPKFGLHGESNRWKR